WRFSLISYFSFELREVIDERAHNLRVVHRAAAALDQLNGLIASHRFAVLPVFAHGVEAVNNRQDACGNRNPVARQPVRITATVPSLVMMPHYRHDGIRQLDPAEDFSA